MTIDLSTECVEQFAASLQSLVRAAEIDEAEAQVAALARLLDRHEELKRFLASLRVVDAGKFRALEEIVGDQVDPVLLSFLFMLVRADATRHFGAIADAFFALRSQRQDKVAGELVSAHPLPDHITAELTAEASRLVGRPVELRTRVDRTMLGGLRIQVDSLVLDASLDHQLDRVRQQLWN